MACASCLRARAAVSGAAQALASGNLRLAAQEAGQAVEALSEKAAGEARRVRSLLTRNRRGDAR